MERNKMKYLHRIKYSKIMAIMLSCSYICYTCTEDWEYSFIFRGILGGVIGYCVAYVWFYDDMKEKLETLITMIKKL